MITRPHTRRHFLARSAQTVGGAALLAWLGPEGAAAATDHAATSALSGTLTIFDFGQLSSSNLTKKNVIAAYEALHPGVKIQIITAPSSMDNTTYTITQLTAGTAPDIVSVAVAQEPWSDLTRNWWNELTDLAHQPNPYDPQHHSYVENVRPVYLDQVQLNNQFWGLAITGLDAMIYYNKDIFAKHGLAVPQTWDQFIAVQEKLLKAGIVPMATDGSDITYGDPFPSMPDLIQSMTMDKTIAKIHKGTGVVALGELVSAIENGTYSAHNADYQETFRIVKDWSRFWQRGALGSAGGYPSGPATMFMKQQAAMFYAGPYYVPTFESNIPKAQRFAFDVFPFPQITSASSAFATPGQKGVGVWGAWGSGAYCITYVANKRGHLDLAKDFLLFLSAPKQASSVAVGNGFLPTFKGTSATGTTPLETEIYQKVNANMQHPCALATANTALGPALQVQRTKLLQSYISGQTSLSSSMDQMQLALNEAARRARRWLAIAQKH